MSDQINVCDFFESLLGDYADGEVVSAAEKAKIETHLKNCARCSSEVAFLRATNFVVSSRFPDVQPPVDLFVRTALATYRRPTLRARIAGWFAPTSVRVGLGSALAAAVIVAVVVPITQPKRSTNENSGLADSLRGLPTPSLLAEKPRHGASAPAAVLASAAKPKIRNDAERHLAALPVSKRAIPQIDAMAFDRRMPRERPSLQVVKSTVPAPPRSVPAIINRLKSGRLIIPDRRESELSMRGHLVRTLPNGDLPKEFVAPKVGDGVPIEETPAPARIAALTSPATIEIGAEPSSARTVVEPPPIPKGPHSFRMTLGGSGTGAPIVGSVPTKIASSVSDGANRNFPGFVNTGF